MADYGEEPRTPAIPDPAHADIAAVARAMKEWIEVRQGSRGSGLDRAVTMRDLLNAGLATPQALANLTNPPAIVQPPPGTAEPATPPTPTALSAAGAVTTIILTWDFARGYSRLAYFEVWRSATDAIGDAAKIAQVYSPIYGDEVGTTAGFYYWVRAVSDAGTSPFNAVAGTLGATAPNTAEVIDAIESGIDATGLLEQLTLKTSVDGFVSGYGLANTPSVDDGSASTFAVLASRFLVTGPSSGGVLPASPFMVQTLPTTINGVAVPKGVYMSDAFLMNGVITNAKIGNLAVDDAKIASVSVAKLTAGKLAVGEYVESTGFLSGQSGFRVNGDGAAEFNSVVARGTVYATAGSIGGNLITEAGVKSSNYSPTFAGWQIGADGNVEFNAGTFRGALAAATGTFKGSLDAATGTFKGSLDAATGTFTGQLKGGSLVTGDYTAYAWPVLPTQKGTYLGPGGLLMGNANSGKYFQVTDAGDMYAPGLNVVNGLLTITAINVIDSLNLRGGAVSTTIYAIGSGTLYVDSPVPGSLICISKATPGQFSTTNPRVGVGLNTVVVVNGVSTAPSKSFSIVVGTTGGDADATLYGMETSTGVGVVNVPAGLSYVQFGVGGASTFVGFLLKR